MADAVTASSAVRDELESLALGGADWRALLTRVAALAGRRVRLIAADGALLVERFPPNAAALDGGLHPEDIDRFHSARLVMVDRADLALLLQSSVPVDVRCADDVLMRGVAVAAGQRRVGALLAEQPGSPAIDALLAAAVPAVAIEAVRRDARAAAVAESAAWLVDELRFGSSRDPAELNRLALRMGARLLEPHAAAAIAYDGTDERMWLTSLSWLEAPVRTEGRRAWTVLGGDVAREARLIQRRVQEFVTGAVLVATGPSVVGIDGTRRSFEQASYAMALLRRRPGHDVVVYDELGFTGLLLSVPRAELETFVERRLGPLLDRDDLLTTLAAWYATGGSRAGVAAAVSVHRNSVGYRLERIRTLLGVDPLDPGVAVELQAALAARECVAALRDS